MLTYTWGYPTNAPVSRGDGEDFGTDNQDVLYCGEFLCSEWAPESYRTDVRNEKYWDKEDIYVERIERKYNAEAETSLRRCS
jgi:oligopeptide transport system substrate-binding protein